jgi:hypothetical protein
MAGTLTFTLRFGESHPVSIFQKHRRAFRLSFQDARLEERTVMSGSSLAASGLSQVSGLLCPSTVRAAQTTQDKPTDAQLRRNFPTEYKQALSDLNSFLKQ